jgi:hypothetical protein
MQEIIQLLKPIGDHAVSMNDHFPRYGRSGDGARITRSPQTVTNSKTSVDVSIIGEGLHLTAVLPAFVKNHGLASATIVCANVVETVQGGAPVIPWKKNVAAGLTHNFGDEKTWISREGIVVFAGDYPQMNFLRVPTGIEHLRSRGRIRWLHTFNVAGRKDVRTNNRRSRRD